MERNTLSNLIFPSTESNTLSDYQIKKNRLPNASEMGGGQRAMELMQGAEQDYRDLRYNDAARKRRS